MFVTVNAASASLQRAGKKKKQKTDSMAWLLNNQMSSVTFILTR